MGSRQQQLLDLLLRNKGGMTVDELAAALDITRTAVNQHLAVLERDGYVGKADLQKTGGRPGRLYTLTPSGIELFPKQYSWFSGLLLETLKKQLGSAGLESYLRAMAAQLAPGLRARLAGRDKAGQVAEVVRIMSEMHYQASMSGAGTQAEMPAIEAHNCVYHHLAQHYPEVCQFDLALLAEVLQSDVAHEECIVRGGGVCRFKFRARVAEGQ